MNKTMNGLSNDKVLELLSKHGENKLEQKQKVRWWKVLLSQFKSPLIYILVIASGVTLALGDLIDAGVIGVTVVINTILGFYQEMKAEKSLEALSSLLTPKAKVIRDGKTMTIEASRIVPGDVCVLEIGERVPADGEVIEADSLSINEAVLTGESGPVIKQTTSSENFSKVTPFVKESASLVYMGTMVSGGIGKMRVRATGQKTRVGEIADRLTEASEDKTPLQKQLSSFSKKIAVMVGIICVIIMGVGLAMGDPFVEVFTTAVAIAVAAIPEGLAVSLTVILAIGMQRIFKRKSLVRKLVAAETLGGVTVICSDKTGTLTEGKMRVVRHSSDKFCQEIKSFEGIRPQEMDRGEFYLRLVAILCNDMRDPLEIGMMEWARHSQDKDLKLALRDRSDVTSELEVRNLKTLEKQYPRLDEIPFDPRDKYIATLHSPLSHLRGVREVMGDAMEGNLLMVSGAPEVILERSSLSEKEKREWLLKFEKEAKKGRRLVGFGYKEINKKKIEDKDVNDYKWLGVLLYEDPIRVGVKRALREAREAGIEVKVITGDYRFTAEAIVNQLEIVDTELRSEQIIEGAELQKLSDEELKKMIGKIVLFARTNPEQKLRIVQALQELGEVVAMTGDGVNDAPAVKKADIGIVVAEASAVAKETADMVILDSNFATIIEAVEEGRGIFVNLRKIVLYLLSDSFTEVLLVLISLILGVPLPITAAQILWINLVDDGLPYFALTLEPKEKKLMKERPKGLKQELLTGEMKVLIGLISVVTGLLALAVFGWYLKTSGDITLARTVVFTMLGVDTLLYVFSCKILDKPLWREDLGNNKWLIGAVILGFIFQIAAVYVPFLQMVLKTVALRASDWMVVMGASVVVIGVIEGVKFVYNRGGHSPPK